MHKILSVLLLSISFFMPFAFADGHNKKLKVFAPWEIKNADPSNSGYVFLRMGIGETLVDVDENGYIIPAIAESWEAKNNAKDWHFTIRNNVKFHDGSALTANDVVNALNIALGKAGTLKKAGIKDIRANGNVVHIALEKSYSALPASLTHYTNIILAPTSYDNNNLATKVIGTGAFKIEKLSPPQSLTTVAFADYWGDKAKISGAVYTASSRAESRALLAESGDADLVFTLDPAGFANLKNANNVNTKAVPIGRVITMKLNAGHEFLNDTKARQALSMAIDRVGISKAIMRFEEVAATQLFPPMLGDWHNRNLAPLSQNVSKAKSLLAGLGWKKGNDGILMRDGKKFKVTLRTFPDRPALPLIATALQDQWRQIGVDLDISINNYSEIPAGHQDGTLHIGLYARNYGSSPDPISAVMADFDENGGDWGAMNWQSSATAKAIKEIATTSDLKKRKPLIDIVTKNIQQDLPIIPIVYYQHTVAISKKIDNVIIDPLERDYGLDKINWKN